jgi:hypothetical protein
MRTPRVLLAISAIAGLQLLSTGSLSAQTAANQCKVYSSGSIRPGTDTADMKNKGLRGPFLVTALQADVDPANPQKAFVIWTRDNTWISVDDFKGPFFLPEGDFLVGRANDPTHTMPRGAVYSGIKCEPL